jgi:molybdenum cofactor synthesis domain-containing protein
VFVVKGRRRKKKDKIFVESMSKFRCGILTVSDRVSQGTSHDKSGPALASLLTSQAGHGSGSYGKSSGTAELFDIVVHEVVPDEIEAIQSFIKSNLKELDLILTTGGTGFGQRDVTPEVSSLSLSHSLSHTHTHTRTHTLSSWGSFN